MINDSGERPWSWVALIIVLSALALTLIIVTVPATRQGCQIAGCKPTVTTTVTPVPTGTTMGP
jgi:hypothetical protein